MKRGSAGHWGSTWAVRRLLRQSWIRDGERVLAATTETRAERGGEAVLADCVSLARRLTGQKPVGAIGVGVCELVDTSGRVRSEDAVRWSGINVPGAFEAIAPAYVESDVRAAALAEAALGAGRDRSTFLFVNVGSGISSALVIHGVPYAGSRGNALVLGGAPLGVEAEASGRAIARRAGAQSTNDVVGGSGGWGPECRRDSGRRRRESRSCRGFRGQPAGSRDRCLREGRWLNSGGFMRAMVRSLREGVWAKDTAALPVVCAELGMDAGVIGAALYADTRLRCGQT